MKPLPFRVLGTGGFVPPEVRTNDWWSPEFVEAVTSGRARDLTTPARRRYDFPLVEVVFEQMAAFDADPFRGARERRVMPAAMKLAEMEIAAASEALEQAGIEAGELDLILELAQPPDVVFPTSAGVIQRALGADRAMAFSVDSACSSFLTQLSVAARYIATGGARHVLCVAATAHSRFADPTAPAAPNLGDGAAAWVLGPAEGEGGLVGYFARNVGALHDSLHIAPPSGALWYEGAERSIAFSPSHAAGVEAALRTGEFAAEAIGEVLRQARLEPGDVDFLFSHQPMAWFPGVVKAAGRLERAKLFESFARLGSLGAASVPLNVHLASVDCQFASGQHMMLFSNGAGFNFTAALIRWEGPRARGELQDAGHPLRSAS